MIVLEEKQVYRNPVKETEQKRQEIIFTEEQQNVIGRFRQDYREGKRYTYLLYGVTGSGKTEVYMEMIRTVVEMGKQAIVLIPEIALTYQTVMRFYRCFGDRVSIMNSRLSAGERYDQMMRAKAGEVDVMIGPRSALFTPFPDLGLIVIDEEHEPTYKSEQVPRYHARETAVKRAQMEGAGVVLGSATPSLEAMYRAKRGEYVLLEMRNRSRMQQMAQAEIVDLRQELREGNRSILSRRLQELMADRLERKEQIMLFLNRRGYSGFISCRRVRPCGEMSALQRVSLRAPGRAHGVPLLRLYTAESDSMPGVRFPPYRGIPGRDPADRRDRKGNVPGGAGAPHGYGHDPGRRILTRRSCPPFQMRRRIFWSAPR